MKTAVVPGAKLRLIEFAPGYEQVSWCENGHMGYVVEGTMETVIEGNKIIFKAGDALVIRPGLKHRSKNIGKTRVLLFLVDDFEHGDQEPTVETLHAKPPVE
jgi:quercetin dioxygenase-like cupin family protein